MHWRLQTYKIEKKKINHLIYTDGVSQSSKNEKELETLIKTIRINSQDIEIEFGKEKKSHAYNEKLKATNEGRNSTTESRKKSELSEKKKLTNSWENWKQIPSSKRGWKKKN